MRAILQRVTEASVEINGGEARGIGPGFVILVGVQEGDTAREAAFLADKTAAPRVFTDGEDKMNLSLLDVGGSALVISNFTLYADCRKGRRPSFVRAEKPPAADELYQEYCRRLQAAGVGEVKTGQFGAKMKVSLVNDGPVTIFLDTDEIMPGAAKQGTQNEPAPAAGLGKDRENR